MNKLSLFKRKSLRWAIATIALLAIIGVASFAIVGGSAGAAPVSSSKKTVTIWIQASDSCSTALPGITFTASGPGIAANTVTAPTGGARPQTIPTYATAPRAQRHCPWSQRTCVNFATGCTSIALPVPASGTAVYTITPRVIAGKQYLSGIVLLPAHPAGRNYAYVGCEGGSDCRFGIEVATVRVTASGSVSASVQNTEPDGFKDTPWTSTGARGNALMFSFFGASGPNDFAMTCHNDGTHLLRDHMTGTPNWTHCNSGR